MTAFASLVRAAALALEPLETALADPRECTRLLAVLGYPISLSADEHARIGTLLPVVDALERLPDLVASLDDGNSADRLAAFTELVDLTAQVAQAISTLAGLDDADLTDLPSALSTKDAWADIAAALPSHLLAQYLARAVPAVFSVLRLLGVCASEGPGDSPRYRFRWDALGNAVGDPAGAVKGVIGWGQGFRAWPLQRELINFLARLGLRVRIRPMGRAVGEAIAGKPIETSSGNESDVVFFRGVAPSGELAEVGLVFACSADEDGTIYVGNLCSGAGGEDIPLSDSWTLKMSGSVDGSATIGVRIRPSGLSLIGGNLALGASIALEGRPVPPPWILLGESDGTRVELSGARIEVGVTGSLDAPDAYVLARIDEGALRFVLELDTADGFLRDVVGNLLPAITAGGEVRWSAQDGFAFTGGVGLDITLFIDRQVGPLHVASLSLSLGAAEAGAKLAAMVVGDITLGPLIGTVENIGAALLLVPDSSGGAFGGLQAELSFVPPTGIGFAVDVAGIVTGGGFVSFDAAAGEYAGVLQLKILKIGICAVGLVETKLPDGGWSMFLALFIDVPSIPLGFGFTLNGVGGVSGVNRTLDVDALQSAVRSGALDSVLFPEDPIADAPYIIDAFRSIFPSAVDRFVFGPVVKIGWGVPTLIEAEVGIVISVPDPITIAVLGSVSSMLPTADVALVALHLDVAGIIDTAAATLSIDASLHDSRMVGYALSGDMALRANFGNQPSFLMALGGAHPGFIKPPGFPSMSRLSLAIDAGDLMEIRFDTYFAIASNSLQFGAAFELTAEVEGFGINGGTEFDALVTFAPFGLQTHAGFHIAVTGAGVDLASAWLSVDLMGPNPWHVVGTATIKVLGVAQDIKVDQRIGSKRDEPPPGADDVVGQLRAALALPEAWSVGAAGGAGVTFASGASGSGELVVAPDSTLGVSQRIVPLEITIDKSVPWQIVGGYDWFTVEPAQDGMKSTGALIDWFAPSSYSDLSPREQLSAPSFEQLKSGLEFGGGKAISGPARTVTLKYEQILRDPELKDESVNLETWDLAHDPRANVLGDIAAARASSPFTIAPDSNPVTVQPPQFVVADGLTGKELARKGSWTASRLSNAGRKSNVTIAPSWEVAA